MGPLGSLQVQCLFGCHYISCKGGNVALSQLPTPAPVSSSWAPPSFPLRRIPSSCSFLLPFIIPLPFCSVYSTKGSREAVPQLFPD